MKTKATLHLRPIYVPDSVQELLAATDRQLLLRMRTPFRKQFPGGSFWYDYVLFEYKIVRMHDSDGEPTSTILPTDIVGGSYHDFAGASDLEPKYFAFLNSYTIYMIYENKLIVLHAIDESFKRTIERKEYTISLDMEEIVNLECIQGHVVMSTAPYYPDVAVLAWRVELPDRKTGANCVKLLECEPSGLSLNATVRDRRLFIDVKQYIGSTNGHIKYSANLPMSTVTDRYAWYMRHMHVAVGGTRFFLQIHNDVFMGHLPSTHVSLENVAASVLWHSLSFYEQNDLISSRVCGFRHLLLRAIDQETYDAWQRIQLKKSRKGRRQFRREMKRQGRLNGL